MENNGLNVLSLFDGMSCGQIALERAGIKVSNYFASEIDKPAMSVTKYNYPNTVHIGDVRKVSFKDGVLITENGNFEVGTIDLLLAGSPCQGFSMAGKQLAFDDPRSSLYFEFERLKREINPSYWLLENVKMKQEFKDVITERLGVSPVSINSKVVSAQSRGREYWTNIEFTLPENRGIKVEDIIDNYTGNTISNTEVKLQLDVLLQTSKYSKNYSWCYDSTGRILVTRPDGLKIQRIGRIAFGQHKLKLLRVLQHLIYSMGRLLEK